MTEIARLLTLCPDLASAGQISAALGPDALEPKRVKYKKSAR